MLDTCAKLEVEQVINGMLFAILKWILNSAIID